MKSKSVKNSLTLMCLMIVLVSVIVIGGISISNISTMTSTANKNYENARLDGYNTEIKSQVQSVIAILQAEYDKSQNGDLTEDEAKKEAAEIVRNMRYRDDGSGYFWIDDTDYNLIMHPILTDQEQELLEHFRQCSPGEQQSILLLANAGANKAEQEKESLNSKNVG